jgi:predicted RNase H-like nuclease (RuvC/YqgF family)
MTEKEQPKQPEQPVEPEKPEFEKKLDEMKAENARMEKNIAELKQLKAIEALGGGTTGNIPQLQMTEEQKKKKGAMEMFEGTGIDKAIEKYG